LRPALLLGWGAITVALYFTGATTTPLTALISNPLNIEFLLGAATAWLRPHLGRRANWAALAIAAIFALAALYHWGFTPARPTFDDHMARAIIFGPLAACLVFVCASAHLKWPAYLTRLGDWSYSLYLVHVPVFSITGVLWKKLSMEGYADNVLAMLFMAGAAIVCAQLFYKYVERPITRIRFAATPKARLVE
jgi:peptidoglycan/LPS O-acetylase OafA/YrhL